jgi:hypothetical protein
MKNNKERAKKIFFDYACNHFYMEHDGVDKEYERFAISADEEKAWRQEYISFWVSQLSVDDLTAARQLRYAWATEALSALIEIADKGDSYAKLRYADVLWDLGNSYDIIGQRAIETAINLWQSLVQQPIELSENHKAEFSSASILNEAKSKLADLKQDYAKHKLAKRRQRVKP